MNLWLIGMMGAGKSAAAQRLAADLGLRPVDTDGVIERRTGAPIPRIWEEQGEAGFRRLEEEAVATVAEGRHQVVATGGGVVLSDANVALMRAAGMVVWLDAAPAVLARRLRSGRGRPLLTGHDRRPQLLEDRLAAILSSRRHAYAAAAHHRIDTDHLTVAATAQEVARLWRAS